MGLVLMPCGGRRGADHRHASRTKDHIELPYGFNSCHRVHLASLRAPRPDEVLLSRTGYAPVRWAQDLARAGLMARGGRIYAMTSSGSTRVIPSYGAVSAAKCALESHIRQLATELAPHGITANALRGGVTDTPAARKIPGSARLFEEGARRNPHKRLTTPDDIARAVVALSVPGADWITGNVINVDGGEEISGG